MVSAASFSLLDLVFCWNLFGLLEINLKRVSTASDLAFQSFKCVLFIAPEITSLKSESDCSVVCEVKLFLVLRGGLPLPSFTLLIFDGLII